MNAAASRCLTLLLAGGLFCLTSVENRAQTPDKPKHVEEVLKLVKSLKLDKTAYRTHDPSVKWKGDKGVKTSEAYADCNDFMTALLTHAYPRTAGEFFKKWLKQKPPMPADYFTAIDKQKGFTKITSIDEVQPGDIIAVKYPSDAQSTGHLMLVAAATKRHAVSDRLIAGTEQWEVPIIDASVTGHGTTDTRRSKDGSFQGGLGMGTLRLYSKAGTVSGYSWSLQANADYFDTKTRPLVIGRAPIKETP